MGTIQVDSVMQLGKMKESGETELRFNSFS